MGPVALASVWLGSVHHCLYLVLECVAEVKVSCTQLKCRLHFPQWPSYKMVGVDVERDGVGFNRSYLTRYVNFWTWLVTLGILCIKLPALDMACYPWYSLYQTAGLDENYVINYTVSKVVAMKTGVSFPDRIFWVWSTGYSIFVQLCRNDVALFFLNNTSRH